MIRARRDFLRAGYYGILRDALREATAGGGLLLDCGCGEGYYTSEMAKGRSGAIGIDVAKEAVRLASKADGDTLYLVASSFALPLESGSVDRATCIFTPVADNEIARVLSPGGKMTVVLPGKRHLWEMKKALYADPYENSGEAREYPAFLPPAVTRVGGWIELPPEAVRSLFLMTPYSRKTSPGAVESLFSLEKLRTSIEFLICVYEKRG